jgi:diadenosine tetraphosphate (Ap4A) HIT family hydrolase
MTEPTIFHKILAKEIPSTVAHEDDEVLVIHDIHPKAKRHAVPQSSPKTSVAVSSKSYIWDYE